MLGVAAVAAVLTGGHAATSKATPVHRATPAVQHGVRGAVNVIVYLPAGHHGGCREATRRWPDGVIGSPVTVRQHGRVVAWGNVASETWDASGSSCTYQAPVRLPAKYGTYQVAPGALPWRKAVALYGVLTYEVEE